MDLQALSHVIPYDEADSCAALEGLYAIARVVSPEFAAWQAYSQAWPEAMSGQSLHQAILWPDIQWPV